MTDRVGRECGRLRNRLPRRWISLAPPACSSTRPRCPAAGWGGRRRTSIDWLAEAGQSWWQMLPLGPPDRYGSPYKARSAFAASPGLLAESRAPGVKAEDLDFPRGRGGLDRGLVAFSGRGAVADQVRFEREWAALRAHAPIAASGCARL